MMCADMSGKKKDQRRRKNIYDSHADISNVQIRRTRLSRTRTHTNARGFNVTVGSEGEDGTSEAY